MLVFSLKGKGGLNHMIFLPLFSFPLFFIPSLFLTIFVFIFQFFIKTTVVQCLLNEDWYLSNDKFI